MGQKLDKHGLERFAAVCGHASGRRQGAGARRVGGRRRSGAMEAIGRARDRRETGRAGVAVPDRVDDEAHHGRCDAGSGPRGTRRTGRAGRPAAAGAREPPGAASGGRPARGHAARRGSCDGAGVADAAVRVRDGHGALASMQRGRAQLPVGSFATAGTARPERDDGVPARAGTRLRTCHRASAEGLTADAGDHVVHAPAPVPQIGDVHRGPRAVLPVRPIAEAKAALFTALGQPADLLAIARRMLTRRMREDQDLLVALSRAGHAAGLADPVLTRPWANSADSPLVCCGVPSGRCTAARVLGRRSVGRAERARGPVRPSPPKRSMVVTPTA